MALQIDFVTVTFLVRRKADGTYEKLLQAVNPSASDPAGSKSINKGPFAGFGVPSAYDGASTVDAFLDKVLADSKTEAGIA